MTKRIGAPTPRKQTVPGTRPPGTPRKPLRLHGTRSRASMEDAMKTTIATFTGLVALVALSGSALAADPVALCRAAKFKAAATEAKSKLTCHGTAAKKGEPVDPACLARAELVFQKAMAKAEASTPCSGDPASLQTKVDTFVTEVITEDPKRVFVTS